MYLLTGFLGLALIAAPYFFGYSGDMLALWTSLIVGAVLIIASIFEGIAADKERWEYWVVGAVGVAAIFAPFVLGFTAPGAALWTMVIIGMAAVLTAWTKLSRSQTHLR